MATDESIGDFIIIGLDFGTTYSGIAWTYSKDPQDINVVRNWNAEFSHCSENIKAPTQLFYSGDRDPFWGYSIPAENDALKWFKLLILDEEYISAHVGSSSHLQYARELLKTMKKDPIEVIACFLRKIWNHAIDSITSCIGPQLLKKSRFHVVVTHPAIWPPYAQQRMKQAAKASGILDPRPCGDTIVCFISEPEAAALATMRDLSKILTMEAEDTVIICDAGGGTVDLCSYVVKSTEPVVVQECVKGDGDLCGGIFLDEMFVNLIKRKTTPNLWAGFLNDNRRTWLVELPVSSSGSISDRRRRKILQLSSDDIFTVFDPIISKIEALVRRQNGAIQSKYGKPAKYIILVGGLGRNSFLFNRLQDKFKATVLQSPEDKPWTAICRGAVMRGITSHRLSASLGVEIGSRVARRSYGVLTDIPFRPDEHLESEKFWSNDSQMWRVPGYMQWFVYKGDNMLTEGLVRRKFGQLCSENTGRVHQIIFACSKYPPPNVRDGTVQQLCVIQWTRTINVGLLPTYTDSLGKVSHRLEYEVEMTCKDGTAEFTVYFEGQRVGANNVEV
ncbi:hypothetical protein FPOA_00418 [Fusarium poae]|uniref:Uncharacterized protein n=1 Tax=Fusarium poae TaxID=36050 RepID=A0A1B8B182_FUSPO|nr:hypothetical protein FPOA_00418 [Fusarium poae]